MLSRAPACDQSSTAWASAPRICGADGGGRTDIDAEGELSGGTMSLGWNAPAGALLERTPATWAGLWSLLYTAGHCTLRLSLVGQFSDGIECAYTAMDLREARDELEWLREGVATDAPAADFG